MIDKPLKNYYDETFIRFDPKKQPVSSNQLFTEFKNADDYIKIQNVIYTVPVYITIPITVS
ncbi:hypothetical protein PMI13_02992 [Chryseobacterium populi]|uniref:Uncharacterized protein n=1 Tax=Chryseobacterium populi TaxID=1144316 RepID=J2K9U4_9FLAO|nr:hypothetical protein PMI13_02992 [Chryseobacterium populi]